MPGSPRLRARDTWEAIKFLGEVDERGSRAMSDEDAFTRATSQGC